MKDHQVGAILAKYGVKRTEQGQRAKEQKNAILAKYGVTSSREKKITSQPQTQAVAKRPSVTRSGSEERHPGQVWGDPQPPGEGNIGSAPDTGRGKETRHGAGARRGGSEGRQRDKGQGRADGIRPYEGPK